MYNSFSIVFFVIIEGPHILGLIVSVTNLLETVGHQPDQFVLIDDKTREGWQKQK